jgi:hypothetical protein
MKYFLLSLLLFTTQSFSVLINHKGLGEALIIPYYSVNNNLNFLATITNTTGQIKAIKINFREGQHGYAALSYNVYLGAYDTWSFALLPTTSTLEGFEGQNTAFQISFDTSCAPFLVKSGHEFSAEHIMDGSNHLQRTREGFVEIIEMGSNNDGSALFAAASHGSTGVPASCGTIQGFWNNDWNEESGGDVNTHLLPPSGGLMAEAQLIDVAQGINYSIPTIALDDFHVDEAITHVHPNDSSLSLDVAKPVANLIANNTFYEVAFDTGINAVSAVLMSDQLISTYALDSAAAGKSETIYTQPTRRFYVGFNDTNATNPYNTNTLVSNCMDTSYGGITMEQVIFDRESQYDFPSGGTIGTPPPEPPKPAICGSVFTQSFYLPGQQAEEFSSLTQSHNSLTTTTPSISHATENGFVRTEFIDSEPLVGTELDTERTLQIHGIPIIGVSLQRFTNAGAGEGLLAQYGGAQLIKSSVTVTD